MPKRVLDPLLLHAATSVASTPSEAFDPVTLQGSGRTVHTSLDIRIDRDGIWYYHGSVIQRKELVCLFASALRCDQNGRYWLITPSEMGPVEVEDAPFLAVEMYVGGSGRNRKISFRTNVDEMVMLDASHRLYVITDRTTGDPAPYVQLPRRREARLTRAVYYDVAALAEENEMEGGRVRIGVWSSGTFFPIEPEGIG